MSQMLNGGTLDEVTITAPGNKTNTSSVWDMIGNNLGSWATGAAAIIAATKGVPQPGQPGFNPYLYQQPPRQNNTWLIVLGLAVAGLIAYMLMGKK